MKNSYKFVVFLLAALISCSIHAQTALVVKAGNDTVVCPGINLTLKGTASGGLTPYKWLWEPAPGLSNNAIANPTITIQEPITFTLTVTDAANTSVQAQVKINLDDFAYMGAGPDTGFCSTNPKPLTIGATANHSGAYTFNWLPIFYLSNPTAPKPVATPAVTTTYTLEISSAKCGKKTDEVTVSIWDVKTNAGNDVTIPEGTTTTLTAQPINPELTYWWSELPPAPGGLMLYQNTAQVDVTPIDTTAYLLVVSNKHGCSSRDTVIVYLLPESKPYFYSSFTPNQDGNNDTWFIGNLAKYPNNKLEIYNRYGQLVFLKNGYTNDWDGRYFGNELPAGTYFYIFDTRSDLGKFRGSVTILR